MADLQFTWDAAKARANLRKHGVSFEEAQTWGRVAKDAKTVSVLCDPTIAMPFLVTSLSQTGTKALKQRRRPQFSFGRELTVTFG